MKYKITNKLITIFVACAFLFSNISFAFDKSTLAPETRIRFAGFKKLFEQAHTTRVLASRLEALKKQEPPQIPHGIIDVYQNLDQLPQK